MNNSSLVDLKAELLRKQQQFKQEKLSGSLRTKTNDKDGKYKKQDVWSRKNVGVLERSQRDIEAKQEEEDTLTKSRKMLEAKTKLYESMTSGGTVPDEDGSKLFLVDFERKSIDKIVEEREKARTEGGSQSTHSRPSSETIDDEAKSFLNEPVPASANPEEDWVDFIDCLGRSRRCMRKDLPELLEIDKELSGARSSKHADGPPAPKEGSEGGAEPDLMSSDMYRERLREQWEREEREAMEGPVGPVHYANVQHEEIRTHGVGFYQFDKKQEAREEQMDDLKKLREQTKDKRAAHQKLKDRRKAMLASRLNKVRQRKMIREGKDPLEALNSDSTDNSDDDVIGPRPPEKEPEPLTRDDSWRKEAPVRDWDKGKDGLEEFLRGRVVQSEDAWMENLRSERHKEFAPPSIYDLTVTNQKSGPKQASQSWQAKAAKKTSMVGSAYVQNQQVQNPDCAPPPSYAKSRPEQFQKNWSHEPASGQQSTMEVSIQQRLSSIRAEVSGSKATDSKQDTSLGEERTSHECILPDLTDIPLPPSAGSYKPITSEASQPQTSVPDLASHRTPQQFTAQTSHAYSVAGGQAVPSTMYQYSGQPVAQSSGIYPGYSAQVVISDIGTTGYTHVDNPSWESVPTRGSSTVIDSQLQTVADTPTTSGAAQPGPQPAHYSSAAMKPQPKKARYVRVNLHEVPMSLPVPPTAGNVPEYPSQEEVFGPQKPTAMTEEQRAKLWQRQFQYSKESLKGKASSGGLKPADIPFASPYIQNKDPNKTVENDPALKFDPCKPPPTES